jgi:hypothetical protein
MKNDIGKNVLNVLDVFITEDFIIVTAELIRGCVEPGMILIREGTQDTLKVAGLGSISPEEYSKNIRTFAVRLKDDTKPIEAGIRLISKE